MSPVITLTTDFGPGDGYVGAMKGVILGIAPQAHIVDISHDVAPQDVAQASYILANAAPYFSKGAIHVAVVDPGVGTSRRPIAVFTDQAVFVGPDNGLFSRVWADGSVLQTRLLSNTDYHLPRPSHTFHGRDIFAPVAAHLAVGVTPETLGPLVTDPVLLDAGGAHRLADGSLAGRVMYVDHFGNLITDIPVAWLADGGGWSFEAGGATISGFQTAYGNGAAGELLVLGSSSGWVEIAMRNGSAAARLQVAAGTPVRAWRH